MLSRHLGRWNWQRVGVSQKNNNNQWREEPPCLTSLRSWPDELVSAVVFWRQSLVKIESKQDGGCDQWMYLEEEGKYRWKRTRPTYGTAVTLFGLFWDPNDWFPSPFIYFNWRNPWPFIYLKPKISTTFRCALPPFSPCRQSARESLITDYAPPERGTYFRLQINERAGISSADVYEKGGKSVIWVSV